MMQRQIFIFFILGLLCSCSAEQATDTLPAEAEQTAVCFDVSQVETRGGYMGELDLDGLKNHTSFGVYAYYSGQRLWSAYATSATVAAGKTWPNFLYNQRVSWNTSSTQWYYDPVKYWPNGTGTTDDTRWMGENMERVSFFAYAPFDELKINTENLSVLNDPSSTPSYGIKAINGTGLSETTAYTENYYAPTVDYIMPADGTVKNVDLLWATPHLDLLKPSVNAKIPFTFHHALAALRVMVQRVYNDGLPGDETQSPDNENDTRIFLSGLKLVPDGVSWYKGGTLNLGDGHWSNFVTGSAEDANKVLTYSPSDMDIRLSGAAVDLATVSAGDYDAALMNVRNNEFFKWDKKYNASGLLDDAGEVVGVIETPRLVGKSSNTFFFLPQTVTLTPYVSYSFVTRDDALELNYLTDADEAHRYTRIYHENMAGNTLTLNIEPGKKYTLLCLIGVESVEFLVVSVEDWDFPLRYTTNVGTWTETGKEKTLDEE